MKTTISISVSEENARLLQEFKNVSAFIDEMLSTIRKQKLKHSLREGAMAYDEEDRTWVEDGLDEYLHIIDGC
ncbi:MAG TPA: hypothetical protein VJB60_03160 [Candidatus Peribacterales bacterium]|nr:hypothetical protein [Candidatus Peribacterales bacterium]